MLGELLAIVVAEDLGGSDQLGQIILQIQSTETLTVKRSAHFFIQRYNLVLVTFKECGLAL